MLVEQRKLLDRQNNFFLNTPASTEYIDDKEPRIFTSHNRLLANQLNELDTVFNMLVNGELRGCYSSAFLQITPRQLFRTIDMVTEEMGLLNKVINAYQECMYYKDKDYEKHITSRAHLSTILEPVFDYLIQNYGFNEYDLGY